MIKNEDLIQLTPIPKLDDEDDNDDDNNSNDSDINNDNNVDDETTTTGTITLWHSTALYCIKTLPRQSSFVESECTSMRMAIVLDTSGSIRWEDIAHWYYLLDFAKEVSIIGKVLS